MNKRIFKSSFLQFFLYCLFGLANTIVHFAIFKGVLVFTSFQSVANVIGFVFGLTLSFFLNGLYNFKKQLTFNRYLRMLFFLGLISFLFGLLGDCFALHPNITFLLYLVVNPLISFLFTKYLVFS